MKPTLKQEAFERRVAMTKHDYAARKKRGPLAPQYRREQREAMLQMAEDGTGHLILKNGTKRTFLFYAWPGISDHCQFMSLRNARASK